MVNTGEFFTFFPKRELVSWMYWVDGMKLVQSSYEFFMIEVKLIATEFLPLPNDR